MRQYAQRPRQEATLHEPTGGGNSLSLEVLARTQLLIGRPRASLRERPSISPRPQHHAHVRPKSPRREPRSQGCPQRPSPRGTQVLVGKELARAIETTADLQGSLRGAASPSALPPAGAPATSSSLEPPAAGVLRAPLSPCQPQTPEKEVAEAGSRDLSESPREVKGQARQRKRGRRQSAQPSTDTRTGAGTHARDKGGVCTTGRPTRDCRRRRHDTSRGLLGPRLRGFARRPRPPGGAGGWGDRGCLHALTHARTHRKS